MTDPQKMFEVNHKLAEIKGDKPFMSSDEVKAALSKEEQQHLLDAKKKYWVNDDISAGYLRDIAKKHDYKFDALEGLDPKAKLTPEEFEKRLTVRDKQTLNRHLGIEDNEISKESRAAIVDDKRTNWVDLSYTNSVKVAIDVAEKEHKRKVEAPELEKPAVDMSKMMGDFVRQSLAVMDTGGPNGAPLPNQATMKHSTGKLV